MISLDPAGFTGIYVNVTIPNNGSICVDEYRASISGIPTGISSLTQVVTDVAQTVYRFRFEVDLCSDLLTGVRATALAITDGVTGPSLTVEAPTDTLNRSGISILHAEINALLILMLKGCHGSKYDTFLIRRLIECYL
jgi:hypothetical protein